MGPVDDCRRFSKQERKKVAVKRPAVVAEYNTCMGGVDLCDRMLSFYPTTMRTKKWTIRTLIFMMDVGVVNSWLLYKQDHRDLGTHRKNIMQLLDFKLELAHFLLASDKGFASTESDCEALQLRKPAVVPLPSPSVRNLSASHMPEIVDQKSASRCRNPGCCERTKFRCCKCNLFLCLTAGRNCFKAFHKK
ncbi:piggyBac transposable element-derived protein 3-like [Rhipicephalus sanguineus]|uniref:piggyBac transposable element-derived protein 3-like n=1 Tax=Rhipicephalus sanguineus TaxID=34632 RepID=UPI0018936817|nr:piggyBac transposable element-derived protein 3-like [Rhipicephalus sanguineus]